MSRMSILNAPGQQTEGFCMVKSASLRTDSKGGSYMDMVFKLNGKLPENMMAGYEAIARHYDNLK